MRKKLNRTLLRVTYQQALAMARADAEERKRRPPAPGSNIYFYEGGGFGLRVTPAGGKAFLLDYRHAGRTRSKVLGLVGDLDLDDARKRAAEWRDRLRQGVDPSQEIKERKAAATVADLWQRVEAEHLPRRSASTATMYRGLYRRYILPAIGQRRVEDVLGRDVAQILLALEARGKTTTCRHINAVLSKSWRLGKRWGMLDEGAPLPTAGQELPPPRRPGMALSDTQLVAVGRALDAEPPGSVPAAAFRVALYSGARLGEVCRRFRWEGLEHGGRVIKISGKTGERRVYLGAPAAAIIAALPRKGEYVFPGRRPGRPQQDLKALWLRIKSRVDLPEDHKLPKGFRAYDATRHTFVTACARLRLEEGRRQLLSGHKLPGGAHWSYLHLGAADLLPDADLVSEALARVLRGEPFVKAEGGVKLPFPARS